MLREITVATRLVIVCNPNNPTSTALPLREIADFLDEVPPHVCVIVDEAYCEFNLLEDPDASIGLLAHHPNLVLLRTFSKVHGLCGLRVGFALCGSRSAAARARPGAPAVLLQRARAGRRGRGARAPGRGHRSRHPERRRADLGGRAPARARPRAGRVAGELLLVPARRGTRRGRGDGGPASNAACSCAPARRSARRARCASRTAPPRRTHASSTRLPRCCERCYNRFENDRCPCSHPHPAAPLLAARSRAPRGRIPSPGDLARRFGLSPCVSGLQRPHRVSEREIERLARARQVPSSASVVRRDAGLT